MPGANEETAAKWSLEMISFQVINPLRFLLLAPAEHDVSPDKKNARYRPACVIAPRSCGLSEAPSSDLSINLDFIANN